MYTRTYKTKQTTIQTNVRQLLCISPSYVEPKFKVICIDMDIYLFIGVCLWVTKLGREEDLIRETGYENQYWNTCNRKTEVWADCG